MPPRRSRILMSTPRLHRAVLSLVVGASIVSGDNRVITVVNNCDYTVWPAIFRSVGPMPKQKTGWEAKPGSKVGFEVEESWGGRVWGRTGCDFTQDVPDYQMCQTGGCNGGLECDPDTGTGVLPVTLAEFNIQTDIDHYDTSNVDGFNIPMAVTNDADCPLSNCPYDLNDSCPDDLQYKNAEGKVVGCLTDCGAHQQNEEYCCFGAHQLPEQCPSSAIPNYPWWKKNCPIAYAYAYDESSGTALFTCTKRVNWMITFCPGPELYSSTATLPNGTEITQGGDYPDYPKGTAKDGGGAPNKVQNESGSDSTSSSAKESGTAGASGQESKASSSSSSGGDSGGNPTPTGIGSGGGGSGGSSGGSNATPSKTVSTSASTGGSSSSSSSESATDSDLLFGMPKETVLIVLGVAAVVVIGLIVFFATRRGDKHKKHGRDGKHGTDSASSSQSNGSSTQSDSESDSTDDGDRRSSSRSSRALAKLDMIERAERLALRDKAFANVTDTSHAGERRRLFSMGKTHSKSSGESSEDDGGRRRSSKVMRPRI